MISVENGFIRVTLNENGGCIKEIYDKRLQRAVTFPGNAEYWDYSDQILFPFCGRCAGEEYFFRGKTYVADIHGFAKDAVFEVRSLSPESAVLAFSSDAATLTVYPFEFDFSAEYRLCADSLAVAYSVKNKGGGDMYFSVGAHPAFKTFPESVLVFPEAAEHEVYLLDGNYLSGEKQRVAFRSQSLDKNFFRKYGTFIAERRFKNYTIENPGYSLEIVSGSPVLAFWSDDCRDEFICAESWWGVCDYAVRPVKELENKPYINVLAPGKTAKFDYTLSINVKKGDIK